MMPPFLFFFLMIRLPPRSTLFPYTTLFRPDVAHTERSRPHRAGPRGRCGTVGLSTRRDPAGDPAAAEHRAAGRRAADRSEPRSPRNHAGPDRPAWGGCTLKWLLLPPTGHRRGARAPYGVSHIPGGRPDRLPAVSDVRETRAAHPAQASACL